MTFRGCCDCFLDSSGLVCDSSENGCDEEVRKASPESSEETWCESDRLAGRVVVSVVEVGADGDACGEAMAGTRQKGHWQRCRRAAKPCTLKETSGDRISGCLCDCHNAMPAPCSLSNILSSKLAL